MFVDILVQAIIAVASTILDITSKNTTISTYVVELPSKMLQFPKTPFPHPSMMLTEPTDDHRLDCSLLRGDF